VQARVGLSRAPRMKMDSQPCSGRGAGERPAWQRGHARTGQRRQAGRPSGRSRCTCSSRAQDMRTRSSSRPRSRRRSPPRPQPRCLRTATRDPGAWVWRASLKISAAFPSHSGTRPKAPERPHTVAQTPERTKPAADGGGRAGAAARKPTGTATRSRGKHGSNTGPSARQFGTRTRQQALMACASRAA
jgi:hypothetical protein